MSKLIKNNRSQKLKRPHEVVNYKAIWSCTTGPNQDIERHNYKIINLNILKCIDCGKLLKNKQLNHFHAIYSKEKMQNLDKTKKSSDITIYRIYLRKKYNGTYLPFPGKSYIGQTVSKITVSWSKDFNTSRWNKHLTAAFNTKHKDYNSKFSRAIRKYSNNSIALARKLFKVCVLQVIKFQGKEEIIQDLADKIECFWVSYYHTQFDEFGWNLLPGGQGYHGNPIERIIDDPIELDELIEQSIFIKWQEGPLKFVAKCYRCVEFTVYEACYYWFCKSYREIRYEKIKWHLELLMMEYFKSSYIRYYFKLPKKVRAPGRIFNSWCEEIYGEGVKFNDKKNGLLIEKFSILIGLGYISIKELNPFFKGLGKKGIEYFLGKYMGGLKKSRLELFFSPRAVNFLNMGISNERELLLKLGFIETNTGSFYYRDDINHKMNPSTLIKKIFSMDLESAKRCYRATKIL